jgi:hypothetical protein
LTSRCHGCITSGNVRILVITHGGNKTTFLERSRKHAIRSFVPRSELEHYFARASPAQECICSASFLTGCSDCILQSGFLRIRSACALHFQRAHAATMDRFQGAGAAHDDEAMSDAYGSTLDVDGTGAVGAAACGFDANVDPSEDECGEVAADAPMVLCATQAPATVPAPERTEYETDAAYTFARTLHSLGLELRCPICLSLLSEAVVTPCGHTFCRDCVLGWVGANASCPLCKQKLTRRQVRDDATIGGLVSAFRELQPPDTLAALPGGIGFTQLPGFTQMYDGFRLDEADWGQAEDEAAEATSGGGSSSSSDSDSDSDSNGDSNSDSDSDGIGSGDGRSRDASGVQNAVATERLSLTPAATAVEADQGATLPVLCEFSARDTQGPVGPDAAPESTTAVVLRQMEHKQTEQPQQGETLPFVDPAALATAALPLLADMQVCLRPRQQHRGLSDAEVEGAICSVCKAPTGYEDGNDIVFCDGCDVAVHVDCYVDEGDTAEGRGRGRRDAHKAWLCAECQARSAYLRPDSASFPLAEALLLFAAAVSAAVPPHAVLANLPADEYFLYTYGNEADTGAPAGSTTKPASTGKRKGAPSSIHAVVPGGVMRVPSGKIARTAAGKTIPGESNTRSVPTCIRGLLMLPPFFPGVPPRADSADASTPWDPHPPCVLCPSASSPDGAKHELVAALDADSRRQQRKQGLSRPDSEDDTVTEDEWMGSTADESACNAEGTGSLPVKRPRKFPKNTRIESAPKSLAKNGQMMDASLLLPPSARLPRGHPDADRYDRRFPFAARPAIDGRWVHVVCAAWVPEPVLATVEQIKDTLNDEQLQGDDAAPGNASLLSLLSVVQRLATSSNLPQPMQKLWTSASQTATSIAVGTSAARTKFVDISGKNVMSQLPLLYVIPVMLWMAAGGSISQVSARDTFLEAVSGILPLLPGLPPHADGPLFRAAASALLSHFFSDETLLAFNLRGINASRFKELKCSLCNLKGKALGACIQCAVPDCLVAFHPLCCMNKGLVMNYLSTDSRRGNESADSTSAQVKYRAFCIRHSATERTKQKMRKGFAGRSTSADITTASPRYASNGTKQENPLSASAVRFADQALEASKDASASGSNIKDDDAGASKSGTTPGRNAGPAAATAVPVTAARSRATSSSATRLGCATPLTPASSLTALFGTVNLVESPTRPEADYVNNLGLPVAAVALIDPAGGHLQLLRDTARTIGSEFIALTDFDPIRYANDILVQSGFGNKGADRARGRGAVAASEPRSSSASVRGKARRTASASSATSAVFSSGSGPEEAVAPSFPTHIVVPASNIRVVLNDLHAAWISAGGRGVLMTPSGKAPDSENGGSDDNVRDSAVGSNANSVTQMTVSVARRRTQKYLLSLLLQSTIVSPEWLEACKRSGGVVHEKPYLVFGDKDTAGAAMTAMYSGPHPLRSPLARLLHDPAAAAAATAVEDKTKRPSRRSSTGAAEAIPTVQSSVFIPTCAPSRAVAGLGPTTSLFSGTTFLLFGEFENPPKNITRTDVYQLIALSCQQETAIDDRPRVSEIDLKAISAESTAAILSGHVAPSSTAAAAASPGPVAPCDRDLQSTWAAILASLEQRLENVRGSRVPVLPPLVVLCDEMHFTLPPCIQMLAEKRPGSVVMVQPEWLCDCVASLCLLDPSAPAYLHPNAGVASSPLLPQLQTIK